jgi:hypothetical protein
MASLLVPCLVVCYGAQQCSRTEYCTYAVAHMLLSGHPGRAMEFSKISLSLIREARSALRPRSGAREGEGEGCSRGEGDARTA